MSRRSHVAEQSERVLVAKSIGQRSACLGDGILAYAAEQWRDLLPDRLELPKVMRRS